MQYLKKKDLSGTISRDEQSSHTATKQESECYECEDS